MKNVSAPAKRSARGTVACRVASLVAFAALTASVAACTATATVTPTNGGCSPDGTLACVGGTTGYSCSGASQPEDADPDLVCSEDTGTGTFCCATSQCSYDGSVPCGNAIGYSCATGAAPPDSQDSSLVCSTAITANNVDEYCCYTNTTAPPSGATCAQDPGVTGCQPNANGTPSYGFSCTGSDAPDADFSNLTCSTPTPASGATTYCCVYN